MPRFVVLAHDSPDGRHWDFMFETGPALATWALERPPESGQVATAKALPDHRAAYLDYEGPISRGRGSVVQWDRGTCEIEERSANRIVLVLSGKKLSGRAMLTRSTDDPQCWRFLFTPD